MSINVVLVEPEIPQNTGNIIRTCANTGATLHLIRPLGFSLEDKYLKRSGLDYWDISDIRYYDSLEELFEKYPDGKYFFSTTKTNKAHSDMKFEDGCFLVFGKETKGLPESLLYDHPDTCVRMPMLNHERARSLNLSNTVAIATYEVLRQWNFPELLCEGQLHDLKWDE